jgi:hypothetical protein
MKFTVDISIWIAKNHQAILPVKDDEKNKTRMREDEGDESLAVQLLV